jgi:feruloyl esterase
VSIDTTGTVVSGFVTDTSAAVTIKAASADVLASAIIRLNDSDVTSAFHAGAMAGTLEGVLSNLSAGPNVVTVNSGQAGTSVKYAQRTITRSVPMKIDCASLAGLSIPAAAIGSSTTGATVTAAVLVPASAQSVIPNPDIFTAGVNPQITQLATPAYCQISGTIAPVDPAAPNINFQVDLPLAWNQKLAQMGGSGNNGVIPGSLAGVNMRFGPESIPPEAPYAITRGYVAYGSDSGHQGNATAWALNKESFANYGYLQLKKTHDVALHLAVAAYGMQPRKTYYFGTSTGGREALQVAQRYPQDYDGILSQVPVLAWPQTGTYDPIKRQQAQLGAGWIPPAKIAVIDQEVRRQCDASDGITDGLVANTFACNKLFDPTLVANPYANIRCPGGADTGNTCLSDAQIATLNLFHAATQYPFALGYGFSSFAGWEVGSESTANGLYSATQPSLTNANAPSPMLVATVGTTSYNSLLFRPEDYPAGVQYVTSVIHATNPDLSRFAARGGKLVLKSNSTDYTANPRIITQYYDSVVANMGQQSVDSFMRYYSAIGVWHNRNLGLNTLTGAPIPFYVDWIAMIDNWVEDGIVPPDAQTLTYQDPLPPFRVISSLPMCRYPTTPHYNAGDPTAASSYSCV